MQTIALLYHDIVAPNDYASSGFQSPGADIYKLEIEEFRRHLKAIAPLDGAGRRFLLTFDDGGVSAILHTAAMLDEYGWSGHFFMTTDRIGTPGFLDERQLRDLRSRKHAIGSHSCSHPARMAACSAAQLDREWRESVRRLEEILGEPVTSASVPGGYYSRAVASAAAAAGIRVLFTSEPVTRISMVDGCQVIGRFCVQQGVPVEWVSAVVAGRVFPRMQRYLAWNGKKVLKTVGGPAWLTLRKAILGRRRR